jgi:hypothetical protein
MEPVSWREEYRTHGVIPEGQSSGKISLFFMYMCVTVCVASKCVNSSHALCIIFSGRTEQDVYFCLLFAS